VAVNVPKLERPVADEAVAQRLAAGIAGVVDSAGVTESRCR
jgi:hypothetical protein